MEEQVADWMKQILSATAFCHDMKIVHRDIKPENILFVSTAPDSPLKVCRSSYHRFEPTAIGL